MATGIALIVGIVSHLLWSVTPGIEVIDAIVFGVLAYLVAYLAVTVLAFWRADEPEIRRWALRESRGTWLQRYVFGTAPGPGVSIFIALAALITAVLWLPGHGGTAVAPFLRVSIGVSLVIVAWVCVVVSFTVTYLADNLVEERRALSFPGDKPGWAGYAYFAMSLMTTFGTTDVDVNTEEMRRTVTAHSVTAFVFNTVTIASVVSVLGG